MPAPFRLDSGFLSIPLLFVSAFTVTPASPQTSQPPAPTLTAITLPHFPADANSLVINQNASAGQPFTVAGERGAILGDQSGSFEAWVFPIKLLSHLTITAEMEGYPVPIDVNAQAANIDVQPDRTTITYAHMAFTMRQIMFAPRSTIGATDDAGTGAVALFEIESIRPITFTFHFTPEVKEMWPAPLSGGPYPDWVQPGGYYILHMDSDSLAAAVGMPQTRPGILAPYQEKPKVYPLELKLDFDPKRDTGKVFPLLLAVAETRESATNAALGEKLANLNRNIVQRYTATHDYWQHFFDTRMTIETPDRTLNNSFRWAEVAIAQTRVIARNNKEAGLVAGWYSSGDSARPGFGWYFGRDTLYSLYAVNSYGDFTLTRESLEFLLRRQREDGKMPHEYSQSAELVDWKNLPYEYAAADATPLFLMQLEDYIKASGDMDFLRQHWDAAQRAWHFETTHDTDGDGIYDNSQGTGWVESWPGGLPHQEIYLAALDQQASHAMHSLSLQMNDAALAQQAADRETKLAQTIEREYYEPSSGTYAFSRNADGTLDKTATIYPAVAWWDNGGKLEHTEASFKRWASHEFSTDWGTRDLGDHEAYYDPISYHQGSVWPLFTGWTSVAEYRTGHPLSGYDHLMQNAGLSFAQDLGAATELLSGAFYRAFGRSSVHQLWSSAMIVTPVVRGLFGLEFDAANHTLIVDPHLPAAWSGHDITLRNVALGPSRFDLHFSKVPRANGDVLSVRLTGPGAEGVRLASSQTTAPANHQTSKDSRELLLPLPAVEVGINAALPLTGAATSQLKVLSEQSAANSLTLVLEATGGTTQYLPVALNRRGLTLHADGATFTAGAPNSGTLAVNFPSANGYQTATVHLTW